MLELGVEVWDENRKWGMSANGYIFSSSDAENVFFILWQQQHNSIDMWKCYDCAC